MRLPNAENAFVDIRKLRDYCLNSNHLRGKHKARVFEAALGLTSEDAESLLEAILEAILTEEAMLGEADDYGQRYMVDFEMIGPIGKTATIRTTWIILVDEDFPRLTSCYVV